MSARCRRALLAAGALLSLLPGGMGCDDGGGDGGGGPGDQPGIACQPRAGKVVWVRDGDTVNLQVTCSGDAVCGAKSKCASGLCSPDVGVRFMALNTGEVPHGQGSEELDECMGSAARLAVQRLALDRQAELVFEPLAGCTTTEGSERTLAYVWVDGILLQERLLEQGLACLYWYTQENAKERTLYYERL
ncbi:MAG: hypothetical protein FJ125_10755, partial [Deltaproteobacteria bacterium]|nr:hypothetical protein [Deltaproteobacteria bacterium]